MVGFNYLKKHTSQTCGNCGQSANKGSLATGICAACSVPFGSNTSLNEELTKAGEGVEEALDFSLYYDLFKANKGFTGDRTPEQDKALSGAKGCANCGWTSSTGRDHSCSNPKIYSLGRSAPAEKRDFDPGVGPHGRDRDKLSSTSFAGAHRSFPITSPGDVSDALQSLGRTHQDRARVKRNILAIARRKGFRKSIAPRLQEVLGALDYLEDSMTYAGIAKSITCPKCGSSDCRNDDGHCTCKDCGCHFTVHDKDKDEDTKKMARAINAFSNLTDAVNQSLR